MSNEVIYLLIWALVWCAIFTLQRNLDHAQDALAKQLNINDSVFKHNRSMGTEIVALEARIKILENK